jgi:hypothetical protein
MVSERSMPWKDCTDSVSLPAYLPPATSFDIALLCVVVLSIDRGAY